MILLPLFVVLADLEGPSGLIERIVGGLAIIWESWWSITLWRTIEQAPLHVWPPTYHALSDQDGQRDAS